MVYVEILAGGKGTRMGSIDLPKQFLELGSKPIIIHTIEQFLMNPKVDKIIICCEKDWINYCDDIIKKYITDCKKIYITVGGNNRNESIYNGCKYIKDNFKINANDIIITHDAVRPFITQRIIDDNIVNSDKYDAIDTVISATDTIVEAQDNKTISSIPPRNIMYQGQTPQTFKLDRIIKLYETLSIDEMAKYTDACSIYVSKKMKVNIVNGETYNIKITTMSDLKIANAILEEIKRD